MNTEDKIYNKIKSAAQKVETPNFPAMESVWNRVEDKLDAQVSKSESSKWKKVAVAASILVFGTIAYIFYNQQPKIIIDKTPIVVLDSIENQDAIVETDIQPQKNEETPTIPEPKNPIIKENINEIIQQQIQEEPTVAMADEVEIMEISKTSDDVNSGYINNATDKAVNKEVAKSSLVATEMAAPQNAYQNKNAKSLVVIDGEAKKEKDLYNLQPETIDSIVVLKNPLYIINGEEFTEEELFGSNPTSPYAPLDKQKILSTTIYTGEDATKLYGKKGKEGVIIITTKNGEPKK